MKHSAAEIHNDIVSGMQARTIYSHLLYLPDKTYDFEKIGECVVFPKNHIILEPYDQSKYCYVVKRGRVVSCETFSNGEERIYHLHEEGALFLEDNLLFHQTGPLSFRTTCDTELVRIERKELLQEMQNNPNLALDILEAANGRFHSAMEQVRHARNYSIAWKICDFLLSFAEYKGKQYGNKILIDEKISQQMISDVIGANRITTVRAIKELKDLGLLETVKGKYCIPNVEKLLEYQNAIDKNV